MIPIRQVLADNLKFYRHILGWSQAKLAEQVSTGTHYIGMIEIGKKFPSPEMIEKLANALGIESHLLFSKENNSSESMRAYGKSILIGVNGAVARFIGGVIQDIDKENGN